jgi:hypothetical protein
MNNTFKIMAATLALSAGLAFANEAAKTTASSTPVPAEHKLSEKEAREACLKDNAKLKGPALKKCVADKRA